MRAPSRKKWWRTAAPHAPRPSWLRRGRGRLLPQALVLWKAFSACWTGLDAPTGIRVPEPRCTPALRPRAGSQLLLPRGVVTRDGTEPVPRGCVQAPTNLRGWDPAPDTEECFRSDQEQGTSPAGASDAEVAEKESPPDPQDRAVSICPAKGDSKTELPSRPGGLCSLLTGLGGYRCGLWGTG